MDLTNKIKLMSIRPFRDIKRKKTKKIKVGKVEIGGDAPISVQSMTNTLTTDVDATIKQINELTEAGADIVRVSCPDKDSSLSLKKIIKQVDVPIVADIHYHYSRAIEAAMSGAHCLRINPGNIGSKKRIQEILKAAKGYYGARSRTFKTAAQAVDKALQYATRDRRVKKRTFRSLWIVRINAAARMYDLSYSTLINGLNKADIEIDRKILADLAMNDIETFAAIAKEAKSQLAA